MKIKLLVLTAPGIVDTYFADDNWKVTETYLGNSSSGFRSTGSLHVTWDAGSKEKPVKLEKVYARGHWLTWETLPE